MKMKHGLLIGFAVIVMAAIFTLTGCPTDADDDNDNKVPSGSLGEILTITGAQVYTSSLSATGVTYTPITGDKTVTVYYYNFMTPQAVTLNAPDKAEIKAGKLTVSIAAVPTGLGSLSDMTGEYGLGRDYSSVSVTPNDAQSASLVLMAGNDSLSKSEGTISQAGATYNFSRQGVVYIYVDKPVTITGKGKTVSDSEDNESYTTTTQDITLNLTTGWNAICTNTNGTKTESSTTETSTMSVGNPDIKWIYSPDSNN